MPFGSADVLLLLTCAHRTKKPRRAMPLTLAAIEEIQAECLADDLEIDLDKMSLWDEEAVREYFESGGAVEPAAQAPVAAASAPAPAAAAGTSRVLRWAVDVSTWDPTPAQWELLVAVLTEEEREAFERLAESCHPGPGLLGVGVFQLSVEGRFRHLPFPRSPRCRGFTRHFLAQISE